MRAEVSVTYFYLPLKIIVELVCIMYIQLRYQRALEDLKTKNLNIQDSAKKYAEMQHK